MRIHQRLRSRCSTFTLKGVRAALLKSLNDSEFLKEVARNPDVAIDSASAFHSSAAEALIPGLAERQEQTGRVVYMIHVFTLDSARQVSTDTG